MFKFLFPLLFFNKKALKKIKLLVLDVDGVLTDGSLFYGNDGINLKKFNSKDGLGIRILQALGITVSIISGGKPTGAKSRSLDLDIEHYAFQITNKELYLKGLQDKLKINKDETAFIGDDLNDLVVKERVGIFFCPRDGHFLVRKNADIKLKKKGGEGCVREVSDLIFRAKNSEWMNKKLLENIKKTLVA